MTMVVRPRIRVSSAACTWRSDSVSSEDVASSRISTGAFFSSARAMARRWRWPPESRTPLSPISVPRPSGVSRMNDIACAASAAAITSFSLAPLKRP